MVTSIRKKAGTCLDCGIKISRRTNKRCQKCNGISRRNNPEIDRKVYRRNWQLKKKYNLEPEEFDIYWIAFRGKCFICHRIMKMPESKRGQSLDVVAVDHDHNTGNFRGLLCNACNKGLGFFKDNVYLLENAIEYLKG